MSKPSFHPDVLSQVVSAHIRCEDRTHAVCRDAGGGGSSDDLVEIGRIRNESLQGAVDGIPNDDAAQLALFSGWIGERGADVNRVILSDEDGTRLAELFPCSDKLAILVEYLNAVVFPVRDVDPAARATDEDVMRFVEFSWCGTLAPPLLDEASLF